jgi:hypothetical protein
MSFVIKESPQYVKSLTSVNTGTSISLIEKGNTQYPEISSLEAGEGVVLSKNLDNSVTISSPPTPPPTITLVDLSLPGIVDVNVPVRGLTGSTFVTTGGILNFCSIVEHDTYVEINGAISLQKPSGTVTGVLPAGQSYFDATITYPFPPAKAYPIGASSWITGSRLVTPAVSMSVLEIRIGTNSPAGSPLPTTIQDLDIRFSLMYEKP